MNDIFESPAFQEFLQKRCEEITTNDEECKKINEQILRVEDEIKSLISGDLLEKFDEYGELNLIFLSHVCPLLYGQGIKGPLKIGG
jgi:hypothetical protein